MGNANIGAGGMPANPPQPPFVKGGSVERVLQVLEFLGSGRLEVFRSVREVAAGTGVPQNACYRILEGLAAKGWADKGPEGYVLLYRPLAQLLDYCGRYYRSRAEECQAQAEAVEAVIRQ